MEAIRPKLRIALFAFALLAGLLVAGCASVFDRNDDDDYDDYERRDAITEVRGRVDRVDTRDSVIYVEPSGVSRNNLRNEDDELALHYDDRTVVEYDGSTYQPRDLEAGDRIVADVDDTGSRLYARDIEVTYDVTSADRRDDDDDRYSDRDDDRYDRDDDRYDDRDRDDAEVSEIRGRVRYLDENRKILELEDASYGWGSNRDDRDDVVEIHYDSGTVVEFEGRRYQPGNLERGDQVQVEVRDTGSRYVADEILVVASVRD